MIRRVVDQPSTYIHHVHRPACEDVKMNVDGFRSIAFNDDIVTVLHTLLVSFGNQPAPARSHPR